jgi:hypothetical protein
MILKYSLFYLIIIIKFGLIKYYDSNYDSILDRNNKIMKSRSFNHRKLNDNINTLNTHEQIINNLNQ